MKRTHLSPTLTAALLTGLLAGCGGRDAPAAPPAASIPAVELAGRPIGAKPTQAGRATAAAVAFVRSLLQLQAGRITAREIPGIDASLRASLAAVRVTPAQRERRARVLAATLDRVDAGSARVTVSVRNEDEQLTYPLPIDLEHRPNGWVVLAAGDDK